MNKQIRGETNTNVGEKNLLTLSMRTGEIRHMSVRLTHNKSEQLIKGLKLK